MFFFSLFYSLSGEDGESNGLSLWWSHIPHSWKISCHSSCYFGCFDSENN